jgi:hypothetical protein
VVIRQNTQNTRSRNEAKQNTHKTHAFQEETANSAIEVDWFWGISTQTTRPSIQEHIYYAAQCQRCRWTMIFRILNFRILNFEFWIRKNELLLLYATRGARCRGADQIVPSSDSWSECCRIPTVEEHFITHCWERMILFEIWNPKSREVQMLLFKPDPLSNEFFSAFP